MALHPKPHVAALKPYQPGKPIEELERELGIHGAIKLASNENPLGPSPKALAAAREALAQVHRYPDDGCFALRRRLATQLGVAPDQLRVRLRLRRDPRARRQDVPRARRRSRLRVAVLRHVPDRGGRGMGARAVAVPLDADLVHDLDAMAAAVTARTRVVFVCNPNNPTGTSVGREAFERFVAAAARRRRAGRRRGLLRVRAPTGLSRRSIELGARGGPGTVVLRTFSKIYGLAGLRVGYGIADAETGRLPRSGRGIPST